MERAARPATLIRDRLPDARCNRVSGSGGTLRVSLTIEPGKPKESDNHPNDRRDLCRKGHRPGF